VISLCFTPRTEVQVLHTELSSFGQTYTCLVKRGCLQCVYFYTVRQHKALVGYREGAFYHGRGCDALGCLLLGDCKCAWEHVHFMYAHNHRPVQTHGFTQNHRPVVPLPSTFVTVFANSPPPPFYQLARPISFCRRHAPNPSQQAAKL